MAGSGPTAWQNCFDDYYWLHNVLRSDPRLRFWHIEARPGQPLSWRSISEEKPSIQPFHFELLFDQERKRDEHLAMGLRAARAREGVVLRPLHGAWDGFLCLDSASRVSSYLYWGPFLRKPLDWRDVTEAWAHISDGAPTERRFTRFVRMMLDLPVVDGLRLEGLELLAGLLRDYVLRSSPSPAPGDACRNAPASSRARVPGSLGERAQRIRQDYFLRGYPDQRWLRHVIDPDQAGATPWALEGGLSAWMQDEMGLVRRPDRLVALTPRFPESLPGGASRRLLETRRVEQVCRSALGGGSNLALAQVSDSLIAVLTGPNPEASPPRQRAELIELCDKLRELIRCRLGWELLAGISAPAPCDELLPEAWSQASLALHAAIQWDRAHHFFDGHDDRTERAGSDPHSWSELARHAEILVESVRLGRHDAASRATESYLTALLFVSNNRTELVRSQLTTLALRLNHSALRLNHSALRLNHSAQRLNDPASGLNDDVHRPQPGQPESLLHFESLSDADGAEAWGLVGPIASFKRFVTLCVEARRAPAEASTQQRVQAQIDHLRQRPAEAHDRISLARRAGCSPASFDRRFKQITGTTLGPYLSSLRLELAKRLLLASELSVEQIAVECGFGGAASFIRCFRRAIGVAPGSYRRQARKHSVSL